MKNRTGTLIILFSLVSLVCLMIFGCSNDLLNAIIDKIAGNEAKEITSFSFIVSDNAALSVDVVAMITGTDISITVMFADVTALVASYSIVRLNHKV